MGKKLNLVYEALLEGATEGHRGAALYQYILNRAPKTSAKRVVKASLFALSDPSVRDRAVLEAVYALAIDYRLSSLGIEDDPVEGEDESVHPPSVSEKLKSRLGTSTSSISVNVEPELSAVKS